MLRRVAAAALLSCLASPVFAQDVSESDGDDIVVTGDRPHDEDTVRDAVRAVAQDLGPQDPLLRYLDPVCLVVNGMGDQANGTVRDRILENAEAAGLVTDRSGDCRYNAVLIVTSDLARLLVALREKQPGVIDTATVAALRDEIADGASVVAWSNVEPRTAQGAKMPESADLVGMSKDISAKTRVNNNTWPRRVGLMQTEAVTSRMVALDVNALVGMDLYRLADYATIRLLAPDIDPAGHTADMPASVIAPFVPGEGEEQLTAYDRAYLSGLYALPPNYTGNRLPAAVARAYAEGER